LSKAPVRFSRSGHGIRIEDANPGDKTWLEWKRRIDPKHYLDPQKRAEAGRKAMQQMVAEGLIDPQHIYGTINCDGINAKGEICGVTTTSGSPGKFRDASVIHRSSAPVCMSIGEIGAAGSTGRGEANLYNLCSYLIVENMRRGMHPKDAGLDALKKNQGKHGREAPAEQQRQSKLRH